jgi:6-phosphofructokinase 2
MVAGIVLALAHERPLVEAVQFGVAAGAAMLQTPGTAPCDPADVEVYFSRVVERSELGVCPSICEIQDVVDRFPTRRRS